VRKKTKQIDILTYFVMHYRIDVNPLFVLLNVQYVDIVRLICVLIHCSLFQVVRSRKKQEIKENRISI
jgi:hypothetical protein